MKVNIGCYDKKLPGFINTDVREDVKPDRVDNHLLETFDKNSVDLIYCCHMFEHLKKDETTITLERWYTVLKPGGILRLSVPDFDAIVRRYIYTGDLYEVINPLYGSQKHQFDYHYIIYNWTTLYNLLSTNRFEKIRKYDWWETEHAYCDDFSQSYLPARERDIKLSHGRLEKGDGILMSLNVEATK